MTEFIGIIIGSADKKISYGEFFRVVSYQRQIQNFKKRDSTLKHEEACATFSRFALPSACQLLELSQLEMDNNTHAVIHVVFIQ